MIILTQSQTLTSCVTGQSNLCVCNQGLRARDNITDAVGQLLMFGMHPSLCLSHSQGPKRGQGFLTRTDVTSLSTPWVNPCSSKLIEIAS